MQTKKLNKKGFTLVELVVVIAIIAVLSAILIPTIGCFVEEAKETKDMTTVKILNTVLVEDEAKNGKPELFRDALKVVEEKGYNVEKLTPLSTGDILWDSKNNRFALYKDGDPVYRDNTTAECAAVDFWTVATAKRGLSEKYSNYLKSGETFTFPEKIYTGLDVGEHNEISVINYAVKEGRTVGQTVTIYANGGTLTINAPIDTVNRYGYCDLLDVQNANTQSLHEYGSSAMVVVKSGRVIFEKNDLTELVSVADNNAIVAVAKDIKMPEIKRTENVTSFKLQTTQPKTGIKITESLVTISGEIVTVSDDLPASIDKNKIIESLQSYADDNFMKVVLMQSILNKNSEQVRKLALKLTDEQFAEVEFSEPISEQDRMFVATYLTLKQKGIYMGKTNIELGAENKGIVYDSETDQLIYFVYDEENEKHSILYSAKQNVDIDAILDENGIRLYGILDGADSEQYDEVYFVMMGSVDYFITINESN